MCLTALEAEVHDQDVGGVGCPGDSVGEGEGGKIWRMALKHVKYHV